MQDKDSSSAREARRRFLASCGKFAVVTPPTITLMLAAAERSYVAAQSGGGVTISASTSAGAGASVSIGAPGVSINASSGSSLGGTPDPRRGFVDITR
jgi:hypothetical protein